MNVEKLVKELGINRVGTYSRDGSYVIDLKSADDFGKIYSLLDQNADLDYMDDTSLLNVNNSSLNYRYNNEYQISLMADFNEDQYKIVINEL